MSPPYQVGKCPFLKKNEHQLQIILGIYIRNSWAMFNWDIYQTLRTACCSGGYGASFSIFHPQPEDFSLDDVTHVTL